MSQVVVNPDDYESMLKLMDDADNHKMPYFGENEDGEMVKVSINTDNVTVETHQSNGWLRENIYWRDFTTEELYHR